MSIRIKQERCIGCGQCIDVCPGSLIDRNGQGKAWMHYPKDCWGCVSCVKPRRRYGRLRQHDERHC